MHALCSALILRELQALVKLNGEDGARQVQRLRWRPGSSDSFRSEQVARGFATLRKALSPARKLGLSRDRGLALPAGEAVCRSGAQSGAHLAPCRHPAREANGSTQRSGHSRLPRRLR